MESQGREGPLFCQKGICRREERAELCDRERMGEGWGLEVWVCVGVRNVQMRYGEELVCEKKGPL